jgi:hypothetical protein
MSLSKKLLTLDEKIKFFNNLRHEIKKKRFVLDEGKEKFGMDEMKQLTKVKNTSQVKGYPFCVKTNYKSNPIKLALKIVPIETKYEKQEHPCNLENLILKELTENIVNKKISPHITHYIGTQKISNKNKATKQLNLKRLEVEGKIRTHSNMLISEYVNGGSLDNWIFNTYENDKEISDYQWKSIIFQLIYTISVLQNKYKLMHNDFHYGNILIDDQIEPKGYFVYIMNNKKYYIKNTGVIPKLWDWEFGMVYSNNISGVYANKFVIGPYRYDSIKHKTILDELNTEYDDDFNVPYNYNEIYDLHYFLTSLLDLYISQELFDWILKIYPEEVIPEEDKSTSTSYSKNSSHSHSNTSKGHLTKSKKYSTSSNSYYKSNSDSSSSKSTESSYSKSYSNSTTDNSFSLSSEIESFTKKYIKDGRLINGVEEIFKLPIPNQILKDDFFSEFTKIPSDFKESEAIFFDSGF